MSYSFDSALETLSEDFSDHRSHKSSRHIPHNRSLSLHRQSKDNPDSQRSQRSQRSQQSKSPVNSMRGVMDYLHNNSQSSMNKFNNNDKSSCMKQIYQLKQSLCHYQQLVIQKDVEVNKAYSQYQNSNNKLNKAKAKIKIYKQQMGQMEQGQTKVMNYKQDNQVLREQNNQLQLNVQKMQQSLNEKRDYYQDKVEQIKQKQKLQNQQIMQELQEMELSKQEIQKNYIKNKEKLKYFEILVHELKDKMQQGKLISQKQQYIIERQESEISELKRINKNNENKLKMEQSREQNNYVRSTQNPQIFNNNTQKPQNFTRRCGQSLRENKENRNSQYQQNQDLEFEQKIEEIQNKISRRGEKLKRHKMGVEKDICNDKYEDYKYNELIQELQDIRKEISNPQGNNGTFRK